VCSAVGAPRTPPPTRPWLALQAVFLVVYLVLWPVAVVVYVVRWVLFIVLYVPRAIFYFFSFRWATASGTCNGVTPHSLTSRTGALLRLPECLCVCAG
jgi:hypothetical protein